MAVTLTNSGSLNTTLDNYGISVLSNTSSVNLGAVSLKFNVPGGVIVKDVNAGISDANISFLQKDKNLYIALFTTSSWTVNTNNTILSISASGMSTGSFTLDTEEDWYNEFASGSGDVFQNFDIKMPILASNLTRVSDQLGVNSILSGINPTVNAPSSSVFGFNNTTTGTASFAEGVGTLASGFAAHAAGVNTTASGYAAFSVGIETDADGFGSFAAGSGSNATGTASFAGGIRSLASGIASFAVGSSTTASGVASLTAGTSTQATAQGSVAFGSSTIAQGVNSFAIGQETTANTQASFAAGIGTFTEAIGQTTVGQWNNKLSDTKNVFLIGGGLNDSTRHNLFRAVGGKNSANGTAERQIIIDVTSPTPELGSNSFFVVSGSSKFITGVNETIELSGTTTITGTNTLSVGGTTTLTGRLTANGAITTTSVTASAVSASLIGTSNNVNLQLQANNTTRVFISSSGNVGIGTTSPTERLHVDGNLLVTGRITAEEFHTEFVSASIIYQSGSTKFGNSSDDIHQFTGSLLVKGNSVFDGSIKFEPTQDPDPSGLDTDSTILFQSSSNTALGYDLYFRQNGNIVKWKWFEGMLESGLLYGGAVTYSGSNVFVTPGSGIIVDHNAVVGSEIGPIVDYVTWNAITQSITNIATQQVTYIYIDNNGVLQQQSSRFTAQQYHEYIPLGAVGHFNYSSISAFGGQVQTSYDQISQILNFVDAFGPLKLSGYGITGQPSSLRLSISSGESYIHGGFYDNDPQFPSKITTTDQLTASIAYVYRSGSGVRFDTNNNIFYTSLKPDFYDSGTGTTGSVSNNNWTIQRAYSDPRTGILYVYYGQNIYPDYQTAIANLSSDSFTEGDTFDFTTFLGFLVLRSNTSDITNTTDNKIIPAGLFRGVGQGGGGGSAVANLDDLTDVSITSPTNGQTLVYNAGTWQNGNPVSSSYSITASFALNIDGGFY
jgi:hypothetical protein